VRLLCRDATTPGELFSDDEIDVFLALCDSEVLPAAAMALENVAANEVLVQKRIKLLDLQTDGPAEAAQLRALAASLRAQYEAAGGFDFAGMVLDQATFLEQIYGQALRTP
jgi:hypothetical protein